jgi:hypothetical protein
VNLDHVSDIQVNKNNKVTVGQVLGKPGTWGGGIGRFEIQIKDLLRNVNVAPFAVFDPAAKSEYEDRIENLMTDLEHRDYGENTQTFDRASMVYKGCYFETLPGDDPAIISFIVAAQTEFIVGLVACVLAEI